MRPNALYTCVARFPAAPGGEFTVPGSTILLALNDIAPGSVLADQLERICEHLAAPGTA
ncbi:hypothetical protein GCM10018954_084290 [Kutzneria kofuensis]